MKCRQNRTQTGEEYIVSVGDAEEDYEIPEVPKKHRGRPKGSKNKTIPSMSVEAWNVLSEENKAKFETFNPEKEKIEMTITEVVETNAPLPGQTSFLEDRPITGDTVGEIDLPIVRKDKPDFPGDVYYTTDVLLSHPLADILPLMSEEDFKLLKDDIEAVGQIEPVVLYEGKILNGRNRHRACNRLPVPTPTKVKEWTGEGGTPEEYVISQAVKMRHLTDTQRACAAVKMSLEKFEKEAAERQKPGVSLDDSVKGTAARKAGELWSVSEKLVSQAKKLQRLDPVRFEECFNRGRRPKNPDGTDKPIGSRSIHAAIREHEAAKLNQEILASRPQTDEQLDQTVVGSDAWVAAQVPDTKTRLKEVEDNFDLLVVTVHSVKKSKITSEQFEDYMTQAGIKGPLKVWVERRCAQLDKPPKDNGEPVSGNTGKTGKRRGRPKKQAVPANA